MSEEVSKYMYTNPNLNMDMQMKWYLQISQDPTCRYWMINIDDTDIGVMNLTKIDSVNLRCDWAYYIADTTFRGRGIGRNLECNIYDYGFYKLNLNKMCCEVLTENVKVIKIHQKFGSEIEGTRYEHIIKRGRKLDIVEMSILKEKWDAIRDTYNYDYIEIEE